MVALLTVAWLVGALLLLWWLFAIGMAGWADHHSNSGARAEQLARQGSWALLLLAAEVVAGPAVIGVLAASWRLRWTAVIYLVVALVLCALGVPVAAKAYRDLAPLPPAAPTPTICQEYSGGDSSCPGG